MSSIIHMLKIKQFGSSHSLLIFFELGNPKFQHFQRFENRLGDTWKLDPQNSGIWAYRFLKMIRRVARGRTGARHRVQRKNHCRYLGLSPRSWVFMGSQGGPQLCQMWPGLLLSRLIDDHIAFLTISPFSGTTDE